MIIEDRILKQMPVAEGGESIVFEYNNHILKIYKDNVNIKEKEEKVKKLMHKNLPSSVIKPLDLIYNANNKFLGYSMKKIEGEDFKRLSNKKFLNMNNITSKDILKMLVEVKNTLKQLHEQNIFIGDLNDCNVLFDKNFNVYFIDVDSWSIDEYKCHVCMDSFKDHLLQGDNFTDTTDDYAFSILAFKSLTKLHPFGGTTNPDMDILERMKRGISVIDNSQITIPKTIKKWNFISPKLLGEMKEIFNTNKRFLINQSLDDFYSNLKYCDVHKEYYYSKYNECPLCNEDAKVITAPIKIDSTNGIPYITMIFGIDINTILDENSYLDINGYVVHKPSSVKVKYEYGNRYYFSNSGDIIFIVKDQSIEVRHKDNTYIFNKINKSNVVVHNKKMYYVNLNSTLVETEITSSGNLTTTISKVAFNNIFEVYDKHNYFICNMYDGMKIINISGYNYVLNNNEKIMDYGIHFDLASKKWLFITENIQGNFVTYVFDKNNLEYQENNIKYSGSLANICFWNTIIFKAGDKVIKGFSYSKNTYKDFNCDIVNEDSKLIKRDNKFIVINEKETYQVG